MPRYTGREPVLIGDQKNGFTIEVSSSAAALDVESDSIGNLLERMQLDASAWDAARSLIEDVESEFDLLGNQYFAFSDIESFDGFDETLPHAHLRVQVHAFEAFANNNGPVVLLVFDHRRGAIVDWIHYSPESASEWTFEVPLVPTDVEAVAEDRDDFVQQCVSWPEATNLVFCIAGLSEFSHGEGMPEDWEFDPDGPAWSPGFNVTASRELAEKIDKKFNPQERLRKIDASGDPVPLDNGEPDKYRNKVLLFCHGIFSNTNGAFGELFADRGFLRDMRQHYDRQVLTWDHWTLSKTTSQNAHDLMRELGGLEKVTLDIVCHSRGAGVVRNFLEDKVIRKWMLDRDIEVNASIFVAGACLGSELATPLSLKRLFRRINLLIWILGGAGTIAMPLIKLIKALAQGVQDFPGVQSMNPGGKQIRQLNLFGDTRAKKYRYIRANFEAKYWPLRLAEEIFWDKPIFGGLANDLVVPYYSASKSDRYLQKSSVWREDILNYGTVSRGQHRVHHTNFFEQRKTKKSIRTELGF